MHEFDAIRTDTWSISLPKDWVEKGRTESGALLFESEDGTKALDITTWGLGNGEARAPGEVAETFKRIDQKSLNEMEGYEWKVMQEQRDDSETASVVILDSLAAAKNYRIVGKVLARPPVVVRAAFHDYWCEDYAVSLAYFAQIIESLRFADPEP